MKTIKLNVILTFNNDVNEKSVNEIINNVKNGVEYYASTHGIVPESDETYTESVAVNNEPSFTATDMRNAFIAGELFESDTWAAQEDDTEITEPDFGEWMEECYNVKIG